MNEICTFAVILFPADYMRFINLSGALNKVPRHSKKQSVQSSKQSSSKVQQPQDWLKQIWLKHVLFTTSCILQQYTTTCCKQDVRLAEANHVVCFSLSCGYYTLLLLCLLLCTDYFLLCRGTLQPVKMPPPNSLCPTTFCI